MTTFCFVIARPSADGRGNPAEFMPPFFLKMPKTVILAAAVIMIAAVFVVLAVKTPNAGQPEARDRRQETNAERPPARDARADQTINAERQMLNAETSYSAPSYFANSNKSLEKIGQIAPLPAAIKSVTLQEIRETIGEFVEKSGLDAFGALAPVGNAPSIVGTLTPSAVSDESLPLLFPETYITYVTTMRDLMRERGVVAQNEFAAFATNDDILNFLPRILDFAAQEEWITKTQAENYKQNLAPGFAAMKAEYLQFRSSSATAKKLASACSAPIKNESSRRITEIFEKYFFGWMKEAATLAKVPVAEAFVPLCYKNWNPASVVPGYNVPGIICCNCGLKYVGKAVIFVPVCDSPIAVGGFPVTPLCDIPLGCLNLTCGWMQNAIWDPTTGICGCG